MGSLSHLIDPRFLEPLASELDSGPHTDLDLRTKLMRTVPNRALSQRSLQTLIKLATQGGLLIFQQGTWRKSSQNTERAVTSCLEAWCDNAVFDDALLCNRCAVCLDRGLLSAASEYIPVEALASRTSLTSSEWSRLISGPCDIRQLTGRNCKHTDADFLMLYRSAEAAPITDDTDVSPRISRALLPPLPTNADGLVAGIRRARSHWWDHLHSFLPRIAIQDLSAFIVYAKEMLDLLFWGTAHPLRSLVSPEDLIRTSQVLQRFGLRAEDLSTAWRSLPLTYRIISRLSWGVRYLSNNLSHPQPPAPDSAAFLRVCDLPAAKQSAISTSRSGHSLVSLIRPLRVIHSALDTWRDRTEISAAAQGCAAAVTADMHEDKLLRREFADRLRRLNVVPAVHILDALVQKVPAPFILDCSDAVLTSAGLITNFSNFLESPQGRAYSEVRLALHASIDFHGRFNVHSPNAPQRYSGIWQGTIAEILRRVEDTGKVHGICPRACQAAAIQSPGMPELEAGQNAQNSATGAFNPLAATPHDQSIVRQTQQSTVANICQSYHGRYDSFAEAIQNSVDALEKRWALWAGPGQPATTGSAAEIPQLRVIIDCAATNNTVSVLDNGSGMEEEELRNALIPNVTFKRGQSGQRGHKGVGTTYLIYGHDRFEIETKTPTGTRAYRLEGGLTWTTAESIPESPFFTPIAPSDALSDFERGTVVRMRFGPGTNYGNLNSTIYNSSKLWEVILRSYTAIGLIRLGISASSPTPPWITNMQITLELKGSPAAGVQQIPFSFPYPHNDLPATDVAELQSLQNNPASANKYKVIYLSRDHSGLMQLLQPELQRLEIENPERYTELKDQLQSGEVAAYASLSFTNRLYEQSWKRAIGYENAQRITGMNVHGGILMASQGMPVGETLAHLETELTVRPEHRARYFLLLHFNGTYRPDIGRKTIPHDKEELVGWLQSALIRIIGQYSARLQVSNEDATHNAASFAQAQQQLQQATDHYTDTHARAQAISLEGLIVGRKAETEAEVSAQFLTLVSTGHLAGYTFIGLPGNETRYDGLFSVRVTTPSEQLTGVEAAMGVRSTNFIQGAFERTKKWLELKLELASLIDEFELGDGEPNKKYFEQVDLVVCNTASLPTGAGSSYQLEPVTPTNQSQRSYPGSTHLLKKPGMARIVEVIALTSLIPRIVSGSWS